MEEEDLALGFMEVSIMDSIKEMEKRGLKTEKEKVLRTYANTTKWARRLTFDEARALYEHCMTVLEKDSNKVGV